MRKDKIVFDFRRFSVPDKIIFGRSVISRMSLIDLFAKPDVDYATATSIVDKLEAYYISSRDGSHKQIALMHQTKEEYNEVFRKLARSVSMIADSNTAIILSSGFHLVKQPKAREKSEFRVKGGDRLGSMWLRRIAVPKATAYVWQYYVGTAYPTEEQWLFGGCSTQATFEMKGLTPGTKVWFRVAAVTREGIRTFTEPVMKVVN
jgi:hypothetical protein